MVGYKILYKAHIVYGISPPLRILYIGFNLKNSMIR